MHILIKIVEVKIYAYHWGIGLLVSGITNSVVEHLMHSAHILLTFSFSEASIIWIDTF